MCRSRRPSTRRYCSQPRPCNTMESRASCTSPARQDRSERRWLREIRPERWSRSSVASQRATRFSCRRRNQHREGHSMIEAQGISKTFVRGESGSVEALKNVSLRIAPGEFVVVRGVSGSGKSTLLDILGCLDPPTRGSYRLDGEDVARYDDKQLSRLRNAKIGFIFQSFNLLPRTTALENVEIPMVYRQGKVDRQRAVAALERVGLA